MRSSLAPLHRKPLPVFKPCKQRDSVRFLAPCNRSRPCRRTVAPCCAKRTYYETLGVPQTATEKEIKSAYRKAALKLHPDVNSAPDAKERFMEAKTAFETLSDARMRVQYDRKLKLESMGRTTWSSSSSSSSSSRDYQTRSQAGSKLQDSSLDSMLRDLVNELDSWTKERRAKSGNQPRGLWEEIEDIGEDLLDFLEDSLGIKEPVPGSTSSSSKASSAPRKTAAEQFDEFERQYGSAASPPNTTRSSPRSSSQGTGPPPRKPDDDVEDMLQALKRKMKR